MARTSLVRKILGSLILGTALAVSSLHLGPGDVPQFAHAGNADSSSQPGPVVGGSWFNRGQGARLFDLDVAPITASPNPGSTVGETITYSVNVFGSDSRHTLLDTGVSQALPFDNANFAVVTLRPIVPTKAPPPFRTGTTLTLVRLPDGPVGPGGPIVHIKEALAVVIHDYSLIAGNSSSYELMFPATQLD
jgi:hypothetical protein